MLQPNDICFIPTGSIDFASSRYRMYWPSAYMKSAYIPSGRTGIDGETVAIPKSSKIFVWQKLAQVDFIKEHKHLLHVWDICDPAWWFSPEASREILDVVDAVFVPTNELKYDLAEWTNFKWFENVHVIPDRMEISHFKKRKESHKDTDEIMFIWFGMSQNRMSLGGPLANLERLYVNGKKISLTILDDRPEQKLFIDVSFPVFYSKWDLEKEIDIMRIHDVALLPPYPDPWGRLKSNNKWLTAWGAGLPVISGTNYNLCGQMMDYSNRQLTADAGWDVLREKYDVRQSAIEIESILGELYENRM